MKSATIIILSFILSLSIQAQNFPIDTTLVTNGQSFTIETKNVDTDNFILTVNYNSQKVLVDTLFTNGLSNIEYIDFDSDNYTDIVLTYLGNNSVKFLYLFDSESNSFKKINGFDNFPEVEQLRNNSKYYYSYQRAGCADMNWISNLFKIESYKLIQVGYIYGQGCDNDEYPKGIEIYKVLDNDLENLKIFESIPYAETIQKYSDKWNFLDKYWNKSYTKL